jgi:hypothetical protein
MFPKLNYSKQNIEIYQKINKIINSCETLVQLEAVEKMIDNVEDKNVQIALLYPLVVKKNELNEKSKLYSI